MSDDPNPVLKSVLFIGGICDGLRVVADVSKDCVIVYTADGKPVQGEKPAQFGVYRRTWLQYEDPPGAFIRIPIMVSKDLKGGTPSILEYLINGYHKSRVEVFDERAKASPEQLKVYGLLN